MPARPLRVVASVTSTLALVAAGIAATTSTANADPSPIDTTLCPGTPVWTGDLTDGQVVHGLTTTKGTTPEAFTGTYVGTEPDVNGNDIHLFTLEGSRITNDDGSVDAGIWAGISGSPVYDADDNLIGSVSYGFTDIAGSTTAGITPAKNLIETDPDVLSTTVPLSAKARKAVRAADPAVTSTSVLKRLSLQRVTVGNAARATRSLNKSRVLSKMYDGRATLGSAGIAAVPSTIEPGGNIATSWSYGDIPFAAVGTVTAVCGDKVYAFGHPDENVGASTQTFLSASTSTVIADGAYSYKRVTLGSDAEGPLVQDGNNGVVGVLGGALPHATRVTTSVTGGRYATPQQESYVTSPYALPTAVDLQLAGQVQNAFKNDGKGEALVTWTINYTPEGGAPATYTRTQRVSAAGGYAYQPGFEVASDVEFLQNAADTEVAINSVDVSAQVVEQFKQLRIARVDYRQSGQWVKVTSNTRLPAKRGSTVRFLVHLKPSKGSTAVATTRRIDLKLQKVAFAGSIRISGGLDSFFEDDEDFTIDMGEDEEGEFFDEEGYYYEETELSVAEVVKALKSQPRYDSVLGTSSTLTKYGPRTVNAKVAAPSVVTGGSSVRLGIY